ncbi:MAG: hypothetical protein KatS3mg042_1096 [Rhodothermaceae bacterium]|nr:MAG: hypothetical protein KatS3mg042_1096 [Rhodothermaceae bacterium]
MKTPLIFLSLVLLIAACEPAVSPGTQEHVEDAYAARMQRYRAQLAVLEDANVHQQAMAQVIGVVSVIPAHLTDEDVLPAQVVEIHQTVQALLHRAEERSYHWLVEREAAHNMLRNVLLPAGEAIPDSLFAHYAGALVDNFSMEYPTILAALEHIRDPAKRAEIAREALLNLDVLEAIAAEQYDALLAYVQASESLPAKAASELDQVREEMEHAWPPMVIEGKRLVPLNVDATRARLHAMMGS